MLVFRLIKMIAVLAILYGVLRVGMGFYVASQFETPEAMQAASARYLGTETSGQAIDSGILFTVGAVVVWMIAMIGQRVTAKDKHS